MTYLPVLLSLAGALVGMAGALIVASRRHRAAVALGVVLVLAGVTVAAPTVVSQTAHNMVVATTTAVSGLTGAVPPAQAELVATDTTP